MSGEELKDILYRAKITQAELAEKMNMSTQLMSQTLKAADLKSGFLEKICRVLGVDMSFFYPSRTTINGENNQVNSKGNLVMGDNNGAVGGDQHVGDPAQADVITKLIEQNTKLINMLVEQQNR